MPPVLTSCTPLFKPHIWRPEIDSAGEPRWRVHLDVAHFAVHEISVCVQDGFLQVAGRHEERPDRDGFVSRCFTRKYKLPAVADLRKMVSSLSADGILTAEVPIPADSAPAASIVIPIKVRKRLGFFLRSEKASRCQVGNQTGSRPFWFVADVWDKRHGSCLSKGQKSKSAQVEPKSGLNLEFGFLILPMKSTI
uniref:SHSP domain-containing protein n=1 Tax=Hippocampus comes TaxID=109280 RepID=A0A3Q2X963_HIPCM